MNSSRRPVRSWTQWQVGDLARTRDGWVGRIIRIFETPWDTVNQGESNTRTVAELELPEDSELRKVGAVGHWFLDHLEPVAADVKGK